MSRKKRDEHSEGLAFIASADCVPGQAPQSFIYIDGPIKQFGILYSSGFDVGPSLDVELPQFGSPLLTALHGQNQLGYNSSALLFQMAAERLQQLDGIAVQRCAELNPRRRRALCLLTLASVVR